MTRLYFGDILTIAKGVRTLDVEDKLILRATLEGLLMQRSRLDEAIASTRLKLGEPESALQLVAPKYVTGNPASPVADIVPVPNRRVLSDEARARIAAAQKKRWAKAKRAAKG